MCGVHIGSRRMQSPASTVTSTASDRSICAVSAWRSRVRVRSGTANISACSFSVIASVRALACWRELGDAKKAPPLRVNGERARILRAQPRPAIQPGSERAARWPAVECVAVVVWWGGWVRWLAAHEW